MFHPLADFPFAARLEAAWRAIRDECNALRGDEFAPWPERGLYRGSWDVYGLYAGGRRIMENCIFCPAAAEMLGDSVPGLTMAGFSRLSPGTRIVPHVGYTNAVLRLHLGLVVPEDCGLRVGEEVRRWEEGRCLVFDDMFEHEAWNLGTRDRLVLLVDFLRSEDAPR
jgi:beta-hydroxylase